MIAAADGETPDARTLVELLDEIEPSTDRSVPSIPAIRTLAVGGEFNEGTTGRAIEEILVLLGHDRSPIQRIAAVAAVVLVEREPIATDRLVSRLVGMLEEIAFERRALEALEHVATVAPTAVGTSLDPVVEYLDHPRDGVSRRAAGIALAVAQGSPGTVLEDLPELLSALSKTVEPDEPAPSTFEGTDVASLQRDSRIDRVASRLILARTVAEVTRQRPDAAAEVVLESGANNNLRTLFDDDHPRIRAAATGLAAHVAERDRDPFEPAVPTLVELLSDDHEVVRAGAVWTLRALEDPRGLEALERTSREDPSGEVRALAAETVSELGGDDRNRLQP